MHFFIWELPPYTLALFGLAWYVFLVGVTCIGSYQIFSHFLAPTPTAHSSHLPIARVPHVTIIRPVNGLEPLLRECLASTFQQNYPSRKLTVYLCIATKRDPAYTLLQKLVAEHPSFDARVYVEEDDPNLHGPKGSEANLGPNPKIRNMSRAYREAKGDIVWLVDSNVWASSSACGLLVDKLCGFGGMPKAKFVHQLPLAVDVSAHVPVPAWASSSRAGAALDELFLATAHAKFYTAIATVAIAPCIVGKSNMFRRSHLGALTRPKKPGRAAGIDFFSDNICEDHLIGDLLWARRVPLEVQKQAAREGQDDTADDEDSTSLRSAPSPGQPLPLYAPEPPWRSHAQLISPPVVQPLAHVSARAYVARRARWLRVRKFTVPSATAVEPGTESLVATACLATAATNVPWFNSLLGLAGDSSWAAWARVFALGLAAWAALDLAMWRLLLGWQGEGRAPAAWAEVRDQASRPARVLAGKAGARKSVFFWALFWLGRELLAFPVWAWAVLGGTTVVWRGRRFRVGWDAKVRALDGEGDKKNL